MLITSFFSYYHYVSYTKDLDELIAHINKNKISKVFLYTTPLYEKLPWIFYYLGFFHTYVVFCTETRRGKFWWSLEKNGEALILQMSRNFEDVRDKNLGKERIRDYPRYWKPQMNTVDTSSVSYRELYDYMIDETDQLNIRYNFSKENCKKFAKIVFDKIADRKTWSYVGL